MIAGHMCNRRARNGKTDGINRTYGPIIDACFMIAGQKWRYSPLMTLDQEIAGSEVGGSAVTVTDYETESLLP